MAKKDYESPQSAEDGTATAKPGGMSPDAREVVVAANARGGRRHGMKNDRYADENVLPSSGGDVLERDGVMDTGYLAKKGLPFGVTAFYNSLPPGTDIDDQELIDSRQMEMVTFEGGTSYPGDGGFPSIARNPGRIK